MIARVSAIDTSGPWRCGSGARPLTSACKVVTRVGAAL